jgi:hypothetical protein
VGENAMPRRIRACDTVFERSRDVQNAICGRRKDLAAEDPLAPFGAKDRHMDIAAWLKGLGLERYEARTAPRDGT